MANKGGHWGSSGLLQTYGGSDGVNCGMGMGIGVWELGTDTTSLE
jgi:hypothetical protein